MTARASAESSSQPDSKLRSRLRTAIQLDSSIEKRLLGYAALAGASGAGVLALVQPAEGKVVFTPTHEVIAPHTSLEIDLNGDGISDFRIVARSSGPGGAGTFGTETGAALLVYNVAATNAISGTGFSALALGLGVVVGPEGKFVGNHNLMGGAGAISNGPVSYKGPWAPKGGSEKGRFLALKFVIDGKIHFGWARFNVRIRPARESGVQAVLTGYAYETEADKPIETGRVKGAEESLAMPAMLGQLALGAAGLVAWRREEDEEQPRENSPRQQEVQ
jgi:hypothetical protein